MTTIAARFVRSTLIQHRIAATNTPHFILRSCGRLSRHTTSMSTTPALSMASGGVSFNALKGKVDPALLTALKEMKFDTMSPVQEKVMTTLPEMASDW